jgi:hypothetical protein
MKIFYFYFVLRVRETYFRDLGHVVAELSDNNLVIDGNFKTFTTNRAGEGAHNDEHGQKAKPGWHQCF